MFRSPFRFTASLYSLAVLIVVAFLAAPSAQAQFSRKPRETNANRRSRIERQIHETYAHRWEVGGGGGYLRFRSGQFLQKNSEITFWTDATYYLNQRLGVTGELRGAYGNAKVGNNTFNLPFRPQISEYPFMAGPTYRFMLNQKFAVSGFALGGVAIGKFDGDTKGLPAQDLGMWPSTSARPAFSLGANFDYNVYPNLAFRVAPSYLGTTFGGTLQNNAGFAAGLVVRFGHQK